MRKEPLQRSKKIYDAVHGFIRFNALEKSIIDSEPFQRLHGIHQLGISYLVYPGATHTRFEHSLGTMHLATQIFEGLISKGLELDDAAYWLQMVRLAALCHDLGHLPFSHDAERELLGEEGHEGWTYKVILHLKPLWDEMECYFPGRPIAQDVLKMALGEAKLEQLSFSALERVLSQIVTGDFFGADRIDYLLRDAQCTGVSHGFFDYQQLIEMLTVAPFEERLEMCIEENGVESCEALLLARHFMHRRVYSYYSVKVYKHHLAGFMQAFFKGQEYLKNLEAYLSLSDHEIIAAMRKAAKEESLSGHEHAKALLSRNKRFKALSISSQLEELALRASLEAQGVPSSAFFLDPPLKNEAPQSSFLILTHSNRVVDSTELSLIRLQPKQNRLLYIDPEFTHHIEKHE